MLNLVSGSGQQQVMNWEEVVDATIGDGGKRDGRSVYACLEKRFLWISSMLFYTIYSLVSTMI